MGVQEVQDATQFRESKLEGMGIEVVDIHAVNDTTFSKDKAEIFTRQRLQWSGILHDEHGEGINFTSSEGSRKWFGDSKKAVGAVKAGMFTSFDS